MPWGAHSARLPAAHSWPPGAAETAGNTVQDSGLYTCHLQEKQMTMGFSGAPLGAPAGGAWSARQLLEEAGSAKGEAHSGVDGAFTPAKAPASSANQELKLKQQELQEPREQHQRRQQQHQQQPTRASSDIATPSSKSEAGSMQSCPSGEMPAQCSFSFAWWMNGRWLFLSSGGFAKWLTT